MIASVMKQVSTRLNDADVYNYNIKVTIRPSTSEGVAIFYLFCVVRFNYKIVLDDELIHLLDEYIYQYIPTVATGYKY